MIAPCVSIRSVSHASSPPLGSAAVVLYDVKLVVVVELSLVAISLLQGAVMHWIAGECAFVAKNTSASPGAMPGIPR